MIAVQKNFKFDSNLLINITFSFFPLSFILGNLIININLILFCLFGCIFLRSKILTSQYDFIIKIIFLFFIIIFFSTSLSFFKSLYFAGYEYENLIKLIKSLVFFRFFLLLIIVYLLIDSKILNLKFFFISAALSSAIVSLDIIYQYSFGFNVIGFESYGHHNTSFFGDELIAGGFIQNFSFFSIFFLAFILEKKKNIKLLLNVALVGILGAGIILSGNRMPTILFLIGLFLIFLLNFRLRKIMFLNIVSFFVVLGFLSFFDTEIKTKYLSFYSNTQNIFSIISNKVQKNESENTDENKKNVEPKEKEYSFDFESLWIKQTETGAYLKLFNTAIDTWKQNKIFGNGIKSFRVDCVKFQLYKKNRICSNHPHNYYLEILTETGLIGFIVTIFFLLLLLVHIVKNLNFFREGKLEDFIFFAATLSFFLEMFPFKNTGSFFTTNNITYIILIFSIILSYKKTTNAKTF